MAAEHKIEELFIDLLDRFTREGRSVSPNKSPTYAPAKFEDTPEAKAAKVKSKMLGEPWNGYSLPERSRRSSMGHRQRHG
jgi:hypothetical protein